MQEIPNFTDGHPKFAKYLIKTPFNRSCVRGGTVKGGSLNREPLVHGHLMRHIEVLDIIRS